jgi:hypothetical protein
MTRLNPELKKLINWARQAPAAEETPIPPWFAARVASHWCAAAPNGLFGTWQKAISGSAWAAAVVIVLGLALITVQKLQTNSTYDVSPAYQVVSTELVP